MNSAAAVREMMREEAGLTMGTQFLELQRLEKKTWLGESDERHLHQDSVSLKDGEIILSHRHSCDSSAYFSAFLLDSSHVYQVAYKIIFEGPEDDDRYDASRKTALRVNLGSDLKEAGFIQVYFKYRKEAVLLAQFRNFT